MSTLNTERFPTFSAFNEYFFSCFEDAEVFDCQEFNLLKVAQEGVKLGYSHETHFGKAWWVYKGLYVARGMRSRMQMGSLSRDRVNIQGKPPYLLLDVGRTLVDEQGNTVSPYFAQLQSYFEEGQWAWGQSHKKETPLSYDFSFREIQPLHGQIALSKEDADLYQALVQVRERLQQQTTFGAEDLHAISCAFEGFWTQYRVWQYILDGQSFKRCWFICHYHNEGLILALKRNQIEAIELQHGIIAEESIFYVYPEKARPVASRALFADQIWVYGDFWKDRLLKGVEYPEDRIRVIGYYPYENTTSDLSLQAEWREWAGQETPIMLVTTQTGLHEYFVEYVQWLLEDLDKREVPTVVLLKTHPAESPDLYAQLLSHKRVKLGKGNLSDHFEVADYHISIFSATLYEACRYGLRNFSINAASRQDHVAAMVRAGISTKLEVGDNPLDLPETDSTQRLAQHLYAELDTSLLPLSLQI